MSKDNLYIRGIDPKTKGEIYRIKAEKGLTLAETIEFLVESFKTMG